MTQRLSSGEVELPVLDEVALRVYREARSGLLDADEICDILKLDAVLVGDVLRMANSSFFGGLVEVRSLQHAVVRLGTRQLAGLALSAGAKRLYGALARAVSRAHAAALASHTSAVSAGAGWLAGRSGHRALADEAFVAGLLHDIGKLLLLRTFEEIGSVDGAPPAEDEMDEVIRAQHAERGAWLLERWGLPEPFPGLVRRLEAEPLDPTDTLLCLVRLVDRACARESISDVPDPGIELEALAENAALGLTAEVREELVRTLREDFGPG